MTTRPTLTDLDQAFLRWRAGSLSRWRYQLGSDAEDFLGVLYLRVQRLGENYCHRTDRETFAWIERVASFVLPEFRRETARSLGYAIIGLEVAETVCSCEVEPLGIGREEAERILRDVKISLSQRVALMGRMFGLGDDVIGAQLGIEPESVGKYVTRAIEAAREGLKVAV